MAIDVAFRFWRVWLLDFGGFPFDSPRLGRHFCIRRPIWIVFGISFEVCLVLFGDSSDTCLVLFGDVGMPRA